MKYSSKKHFIRISRRCLKFKNSNDRTTHISEVFKTCKMSGREPTQGETE